MTLRVIQLCLFALLAFGLVCACSGSLSQDSVSTGSQLSESVKAAPHDGDSPKTQERLESPCRMVKHALGETCVPAHPQRVVALVSDAVVSLLSLGVQPIGAVSNVPSFVLDKLKDVEILGYSEQVNLEKILLLKPDLILAQKWNAEPVYDKLSKIAPTVITDFRIGEWKEALALHAEALGMTDKAKQLMAQYDERIERFKAQMGRLKQTSISLIGVYPEGIFIFFQNSFGGTILEDIGLPRPPAQVRDNSRMMGERISKELMRYADGDVILAWSHSDTLATVRSARENLNRLKSDPLWLKLDAVEQGRVYQVEDHWTIGSPLTANLVLDDLFKYLIEERSKT
ncbi:MAG: iron-siderophore ABC transporter substrate-binding protein [Symplocastrum torsivum CPER-KK1]|uniref:Iron-siderophore ABC transporter substrate-binding protein n=1 Tax=Symplocastrum torsivum CPER-KK1 TaxID=450513 RepID=A0A951PG02_9CYAN|nr:iron-siderophore ABC transporter substrate-binding protein [Symplocastrum torsivum CPER-KK1]